MELECVKCKEYIRLDLQKMFPICALAATDLDYDPGSYIEAPPYIPVVRLKTRRHPRTNRLVSEYSYLELIYKVAPWCPLKENNYVI